MACLLYLLVIVLGCSGTSEYLHCHHFQKEEAAHYHELSSFNTSRLVAIKHVITHLGWRNVILLYDDMCDLSDVMEVLHDELQPVEMSSMQLPVNLSSTLHEYFLSVHNAGFSLRFLVITSWDRARHVMKIAEYTDHLYRRRTDFRHQSRWVVSSSKPLGAIPVKLLENVVLVESSRRTCAHKCGPSIYTLHNTHGRRRFKKIRNISNQLTKDALFPNLKFGLNNRTLIISVVQYPGIVQRNKFSKHWEGYFFDILQEMALSLNFNYQIVEPEDKNYGLPEGKSWNGLIGQLQRKEVDLTVAPMTINNDREQVMDFLLPSIYTVSEDFVYRYVEGDGVRGLQPQPLGSLVLVALLAVYCVFNIMLVILAKWDDVFKEQGHHHTCGDRLLYTLAILFQRGHSYNPYTWTVRILVFTWGVFALIIACTYSGNLTSSLTVNRHALPFRTLGEMVRQTDYKWGFRGGDITQFIFQNSKSGDMKRVWDGINRFRLTDSEVLHTNQSVHIRRLLREKYAYLAVPFAMTELMSQDCQLYFLGEHVIQHHVAFGVPSNYPLKKLLETTIARMKDSGLLTALFQKWIPSPVRMCKTDTRERVLNLKDFQLLVYIFCIGIGASLAVIVAESTIHLCRKHTKPICLS